MAATTMAEGILNDLLQGEISAVETYVHALGKLEGADRQVLEQIETEHVEACNLLRKCVHQQHGSPEKGSGVWGALSKLVVGTANVFGRLPALKALKEGEEHGIQLYHQSLEDRYLPVQIKDILLDRFISAGKRHIVLLDRLMEKK